MDLPNGKKTTLSLYTTATEAYNLLINEPKSLFIDVRTPAELTFVGFPTIIDANIPYEFIDDWYQWNDKTKSFQTQINPNFIVAVEDKINQKKLTRNSLIIFICRSGYRSARSANLLAKEGYMNVYNLIDGFEGDNVISGLKKGQRIINGWKNSNLPWTAQLDKEKMYFG
ncbi:MAG: hypothetical protein KAH84_07450 [Thiomargarita sp.]|nr:hypothetical protein [Thiomargarita sp.]